MLERVGERISDGRLLELIHGFMKAEVLEDGETIQPEGGTPQGGVVSPLLANIYLDLSALENRPGSAHEK